MIGRHIIDLVHRTVARWADDVLDPVENDHHLAPGAPLPIRDRVAFPLAPPVSPSPFDTFAAIVNELLDERRRQVGLGYDAAHDDAHTDGLIAFEAAAAIMPRGARLDAPLGSSWTFKDDWIDPTLPRRARLVQGIALAIAELERVDRVGLAAEELARQREARTHGADSAIDDEILVEVVTREGVADLTRLTAEAADGPCPNGSHCCCCGPGEPCCDCGERVEGSHVDRWRS
jgi:hypothetical protein